MKNTRILRYLLLIILAVFIFYIIQKYRVREPEAPETEEEMAITEDSQIGQGVEIVTPVFKLKAERSIYQKGGNITYQVIELQTKKGDRLVTITADEAEVVHRRERLRRAILKGNVRAYTDDGMELRSNRLNFFHQRNSVTSPGEVHFSKGKMSGSASRFIYFLNNGVIQFVGDVEIEIIQEETQEQPSEETEAEAETELEEITAESEEETIPEIPKPPIIIKCGLLQYEPKKHSFYLDGDIAIKRGEEYLYTQRINGQLTEDNMYATQIEALGAIESRFGTAEAANVKQENPSTEGQRLSILKLSEGIKNLSCGRLLLYFNQDEENSLKRIEAINNARLEIAVRSPVTARVVERRVIKANRLEMELRENSQQIERLSAKRNARIEIFNSGGSRPEKIMEANEIRGRFNPTTGELVSSEFIGRFKFFQEQLEASAHRAIYSDQEGSLDMRGNPQAGNPQVIQEGNKVTADKIYYSHRSEELLAQNNVVSEQPPETLKDMFEIEKADKPVVFNSDMMVYNHRKKTIHYFGRVKGMFGSNILWADRVLIEQDEGKLTAEGNVKSILPQEPSADSKDQPEQAETSERTQSKPQQLEVFSPYMEYKNQEGIIEYRNGVDMRQGTVQIKAEEIDLYQKEGENTLDHALARNDVEVSRGDMKALGDAATYNFKERVMEVRGKEARFIQQGKTEHTGKILTFYLDNDRMVLKANEDGRVKTTYKP